MALMLGHGPASGQQPGGTAASRAETIREAQATDDRSTWKLSLTLSPSFGSDLKQDRGDRLTDAVNSSKLLVENTTTLNPDLVLDSYFGAQWKTDFEDDDDADSSGLVGGSKLEWKRGCRTLNPFASVDLERGHERFFGARGDDSLTLAAGLNVVIYDRDLCVSGLTTDEIDRLSSFKLKVSPSIEGVDSSDPVGDRWGPRVKIEASKNLVRGIKLLGDVDYQYRIFNAVESGSRERHRFAGTAGLDFAQRLFGAKSLVQKLAVGASWEVIDIEETGILQDESKLTFLLRFVAQIPRPK